MIDETARQRIQLEMKDKQIDDMTKLQKKNDELIKENDQRLKDLE